MKEKYWVLNIILLTYLSMILYKKLYRRFSNVICHTPWSFPAESWAPLPLQNETKYVMGGRPGTSFVDLTKS